MSRFTRNLTHLPILPTPGLDHPRYSRLRFHSQDPANGTPGVAPAAPAAGAPVATVVDPAATAPAATPPVPTPPAPGAPAATDPATPPNALPTDVASLQAMIGTLRQENGKDRTQAKETAAQEARAALAQDIGKALGIIPGDAAPDPAALTAAAQEATARANAATVELAVYRSASNPQAETKADPVALLDSRAFLAKVQDLDPTAADFQATLDAAIKAAVTENPKLAAQAAAPASPRRTAVGNTSGTGERLGTAQPTSLNAAVAAAYTQQ